jgi:hypothetical protein
LETSGGSVTVYLEGRLSFDLDAKTSGGRVYSDSAFDLNGTVKKTNVVGRLNGGGPELYLRTSGGGIRIKSGRF